MTDIQKRKYNKYMEEIDILKQIRDYLIKDYAHSVEDVKVINYLYNKSLAKIWTKYWDN